MTPLPCPFSYEEWHGEVRAWLEAHPSAHWAVAVSGGADSVALLYGVATRAREVGKSPVVLHFNHALRGEESDGDAESVAALARSLGLVFVSSRWSAAPADGAASETAARDARMAFVRSEMVARQIDVLFTGHHADDVAETLLLRLSRGSGAGGLSAPRPVQEQGEGKVFLRPLLTQRKQQLLQSLRERGISWREDATNTSAFAPRNALRLRVMDSWIQASGRDAVAGALRTRSLLDEDERALTAWTDRLLEGQAQLPEEGFAFDRLADAPTAVWRRALHRWPPAARLSAAAFDQLIEFCRVGRGRLSAGEGTITIAEKHLLWTLPAARPLARSPVKISFGQSVQWERDQSVTYALEQVGRARVEEICAGRVTRNEAWLQAPEGPLWVRSWQPGDRYAPLGFTGSKKVQDWWVDRKVPLEKRSLIPLVVNENGEVVWIPGFPPADAYRVQPESGVLGHLTYGGGTLSVLDQSFLPNV